jgi:hypothetical protein
MSTNTEASHTTDTQTRPPRHQTTRRIGLSVREAAWLLALSESQIRRRIARGELDWAVAPGRLNATRVRALFPDDEFHPLRNATIDLLLAGRLRIPPPASRYAKPGPITDLARHLNTTTLPTRCSFRPAE